MKMETYLRDRENPLYTRALVFIDTLLKAGVELCKIDTNDFNSSTNPGIYISKRHSWFKHRVYHRWSEYDVQNALRFYKNNF